VSATPFADYFTIEDYQALTGDTSTDPLVARAQALVVRVLEKWARTSWANVDVSVDDADLPEMGLTNAYRTQLDTWGADRKPSALALSRIPLVGSPPAAAGLSLQQAGTDLATDGYEVLPSGIVVLAAPQEIDVPDQLVASYAYGFGACPEEVLWPVIAATRARLMSVKSSKRIPPNTRSYTTETVTFELQGPSDLAPWPWDFESSVEIRSYWNPSRPRGVVAV
jgi:hypothetical protein